MIQAMFQRFRRSRRGAVFVIFAIAIVPLLMLIGLSIDYSFFAQARAQFQLAGDAAATYAIREATATYALETQAGSTQYPNPETDAEAAGKTAGNTWFNTQIATLPTAYLSSSTPNTTVTANNTSTGTAAGFTATVAYTGVYPPFFDLLFKSTKNWYVTGTSAASSSYSYVEVLLMLDTSGSMLIGADSSDVTAIDDATACVLNNDMSWTTDVDTDNGPYYPAGTNPLSSYYNSDSRNVITWSNVSGYNGTTQTNGSCSPSANYNGNTGHVMSPCAFACHTTTATFSGSGGKTYTKDYYGIARSLNPNQTTNANGGVTLRIDAMFLAAENVITDMENQQQVSGQFSVGVYQFNDDVYCIYAGGCNSVTGEASTGLSAALSAVKADDWISTPTETAVPKISVCGSATSEQICYDYDNFPLSMQHLQSGALASGTSTAITPSGTGTTATYNASVSGSGPIKDLIIVTDAMEDSTPSSSVGRLMGEMDGLDAEAAGGVADANGNTGVCNWIKNLGFNVYVLYVNFNPIPILTYYYSGYDNPSTPYTNEDFPAVNQSSGGNIENWVEGDNTGNTTQTTDPLPSGQIPPNILGIAACASGNGSYGSDWGIQATTSGSQTTYAATGSKAPYFQYANSSAGITSAMDTILKNALNATTRITQ